MKTRFRPSYGQKHLVSHGNSTTTAAEDPSRNRSDDPIRTCRRNEITPPHINHPVLTGLIGRVMGPPRWWVGRVSNVTNLWRLRSTGRKRAQATGGDLTGPSRRRRRRRTRPYVVGRPAAATSCTAATVRTAFSKTATHARTPGGGSRRPAAERRRTDTRQTLRRVTSGKR